MSRISKSRIILHIDGAARGNPGPAGAGVLLSDESKRVVKEIALYLGETTNNVAETCALIIGLQEALKRRCQEIRVFTDSELLARQVQGKYRVKDSFLRVLHVLIHPLVGAFRKFEIQHIPRIENRHADRLANKAVTEGLRDQSRSRKKKPASVSSIRSSQPTFWSMI